MSAARRSRRGDRPLSPHGEVGDLRKRADPLDSIRDVMCEEARTREAMRARMYVLADALGVAIGKQFPDKFT